MGKKLTQEGFINRSKEVHGDKYDYSLVEYNGAHEKIKIICSEHGIFEQLANSHLMGVNCKKCTDEFITSTTEEFIEKAKKIHGYKYDYSLVEYKTCKVKIKIICKEHGVFIQRPDSHLNGGGCQICSNKINLTTEEFINRAKKIHKNIYDYSLVKYKNNNTKVKIICPKHGIFEQEPRIHINIKHGCTYCKESKGENKIIQILNNKHIIFKKQKSFNECKDNRLLKFDFYLPDYNTCIEYDGIQHFEAVSYWGGINNLINVKKKDKIKNEYCKNNNINLLRIRYDENIEEKLNNYFNLNH